MEDNVTVVKEISKRAPASASDLQQDLREDLERAAHGEWTVRDLASKLDVPPGFILTINGKPYITKEGLLQQARRIGYDAIWAELHEIEGGYEAIGYVRRRIRDEELHFLQAIAGKVDKDSFNHVYRQIFQTTNAHGTATKDNVRLAELRDKYLRELAETRAINRALRLFTGCGLVSVDELEDVGKRGLEVKT